MATREIVGWSMADSLRADLACDALLMAIRRRQPPRGLLHHSDRGGQGGFKRSSQRYLCERIGGPRPAPRLASSSRGSSEAWR
jgi:putative transposase